MAPMSCLVLPAVKKWVRKKSKLFSKLKIGRNGKMGKNSNSCAGKWHELLPPSSFIPAPSFNFVVLPFSP